MEGILIILIVLILISFKRSNKSSGCVVKPHVDSAKPKIGAAPQPITKNKK